jgi:type IV fimbrial biogenesis protein FimT
MRNKKQRGIGVIETVVCLAVLGILIMLGLQSLVVWLQNQQLRRSSEDMVDGVLIAHGEAIHRNLPVQISFGPGTGWTVREVTSGAVIQMEEGLPNAALTTLNGVPATTLTFNSLGGIAANADGSPSVTKIDVTSPAGGACQPGGAMRCLRLTISADGRPRVCDPLATSRDPRRC